VRNRSNWRGFLVNDIVCLALTPLVLHLARRLRFNPVPHLIGLASQFVPG
jgi:Na+/H+ antiporter NhaD/arsenite permease-like protein